MTQAKTFTAQTQVAGAFLRRYADWVVGLGVLGLMVTLITPVNPFILDVLLAANVTISLLLLLVVMNARSARELSTFPTILLFTTLFRLGLNVASTRLILTHGKAGNIIHAFGEYVGGDNLAVGIVVFLILVVIQFVVITKGSGRISEVAARFVLDAMPGKQMAIDADLNSGLIDATEARARRAAIAQEAEFYGAMDGASKFVRGDAIAGLIITVLNLVCGIAIATWQGMAIADAGDKYSKLTIGDGLVSQIPALFISTAAAVLVTKNTSDESLGTDLLVQVSGRPRAALIAAGMLFVLGLLPGMPRIPFFVLSTMLVLMWRSGRGKELAAEREFAAQSALAEDAAAGAAGEKHDEQKPEELLQVDRLSLEIGYRLIPLVQEQSGGGILEHIGQLRKRFALNEGVVLPPVRIKDNIRLGPNTYRVLVGGQEVARGEIEPGQALAMDSGTVTGKVKGKKTTDPAFGLPAWWIAESLRNEAEMLGYTVIDPVSVLVTHLSETVRNSIGDILSRDDVKDMVETIKKTSPAVVEELIPSKMGYGDVQRVLKALLRDGVSVRNLPAILEVLADNAAKVKDHEALAELARTRMGRMLCEMHADADGVVHAVTLDPEIESRLAAAVGGSRDPDSSAISPAFLQKLMEQTGAVVAQATHGGKNVVLLVRSNVRRFLNELARASLPKVAVLSYNEVVPARSVVTQAVVRMEE
ncbi:MAG: flagellar biosynthesis protein FlhA [Planctomycetes bacterium]|nr:flagellar biosynthesis protein FlhA [Planctomycetota bacterium]